MSNQSISEGAVRQAGGSLQKWMRWGLWVVALLYPLYMRVAGSDGWLTKLGSSYGLGHGLVDFAGASLLHLAVGVAALAGAWMLGPRGGEFFEGKPGSAGGLPLEWAWLGAGIVALGWMGWNAPAGFPVGVEFATLAAWNAAVSSAAGAVCALGVGLAFSGRLSRAAAGRGMLGGLVAISASGAFVTPVGALMTGAIAGLVVVASARWVERRFESRTLGGLIAVHGVCGAWGALSLGIFANGAYGAGLGGLHYLLKRNVIWEVVNDGSTEVREMLEACLDDGWRDLGVNGIWGPLFGGAYTDWGQLGASALGILTTTLCVGAGVMAWFGLVKLAFAKFGWLKSEDAGAAAPGV